MMRALSVLAGLALAVALPVPTPGHPGDGEAIAGPGKTRRHRKRKPAPPAAPTPAPAPSPAPDEPAPDAPAPGPDTAPAPVPPPAPTAPVLAPPSPWPEPASGAPGALPSPAEAARAVEAARAAAPAATAAADSPHGGFVADMDCSACHTAEGWSLSSTAGASGFDHDRTGFPLRGAHAQRTCTDCHTSNAQPATTCEGCHRDPHEGRMDGACAECHQATAWTDTDALDLHRRTRMPLTGRHATVECSACHTRQSERTWTDLPTDCYACHRADYQRTDIHPLHTGDPNDPSAGPFPRDCARCHRTSGWTPAVTDPTTLPRTALAAAELLDHDAWFVLSSGPHRGAECTSCHADRRRMQRTRCDGCHTAAAIAADHSARTVARSARSCLRCHPRGTTR